MKKEVNIEIPSVPNFISVGSDRLSITEFSDEELREIGKLWTEKLIERSKEITKSHNF